MSTKKNKKDNRSKSWTLIVYPESAPKDWRSQLDAMHIPWIESPLHEKDVNPDGTIKKAHWHILLMFSTNKSFTQVKDVADELNAPIPQPCRNRVGMVRYFAHLDNPEKYQYKPSDIVGHSGADPRQYLVTSSEKREDRLNNIKAMQEFIRTNDIVEFADLFDYAAENEPRWFESLCEDSTYVMGQYVKSRRFRFNRGRQ